MRTKFFFLIALFVRGFLSQELLTFLDDNDYSDKLHDGRLVSIDFNLLRHSERVSLPFCGSLKKSHQNLIAGQNTTSTVTFKNEAEGIEAIFVFGETDGELWAVGVVHLPTKEEKYSISHCADKNCFLWRKEERLFADETGDDVVAYPTSSRSSISPKKLELAKQGSEDPTTVAIVTITVLVTVNFRQTFHSFEAMKEDILLSIETANVGFLNSEAPVELILHCILDSKIEENGLGGSKLLAGFNKSDNIGFNLLKQSADIVVLLYVGPETSGLCGEAFHINPLEWDVHIAVMKKSCPVTDYLFGHEVGHLFGCLHNRERHDSHGTAHGFLMRPPVESGYRTIMAYPYNGYNMAINHYSNPAVLFMGKIPTGDELNDNVAQIRKTRFILAASGNEEQTCQWKRF